MIRARVHQLLEPGPVTDTASRLLDAVIVTLIILSAAAVIVESVPSILASAGAALNTFEITVSIAFAVEYAGRVWSCVEDPRYRHPLWGRLRYAASIHALIDLAAFLPSLITLGPDLRVLRLLRVFRMLRLLKLGRYTGAIEIIVGTLRRTRGELFVTFLFILTLLVIAATLMHYAEGAAQPDAFGTIPDAMWWAIVTMTTVGYGDVYPVTPLGRLIAAVIAILAIGLVALPTGILGAGFTTEMQRRRPGADAPPASSAMDSPGAS